MKYWLRVPGAGRSLLARLRPGAARGPAERQGFDALGGDGPARGLVSDALLGHALDTVSEGSLVTDADQRIVYANAAFTAVTGYSAAEVIGRNCSLLQGPGTDSLTVTALRVTLSRQENFRGEILNYRKDGTPFWNALTVSPIRDSGGAVTHFVSVQRDITTQKALQERLRFMALHDPVTGLPNRTALDQHLSSLTRRHAGHFGHAAVGVIDLDDFKPVNDTYGHEAGDALLTAFAGRIRLKMRETDFLARLGGDEFVIVIEDLEPESAREQLGKILDRIHQVLDSEFVLAPSVSVQIGMSLGLALYAPTIESGGAVLRRADAALYDLKSRKAHRTRWWQLDDRAAASLPGHDAPHTPLTRPVKSGTGTSLSPSVSQTQRDRLFSGGLRMYFQPVVDLRHGKLHLLEALARLCLEDGTILPPGAFLPQLNEEDTSKLFREVLEQTLKQLADWDSLGPELRASVNLHPRTLLEPQCPNWVASALDRHNIAPHRLVLELLEDGVDDSHANHHAFNELLALGVGMAQDDLGAGHSSIRRLTALAFDTVKIDHRVTAQINTSPIPTLTFLATLTTMGQNMGWKVIAEGLEDAGITEAATILGIPYGQGYHIARPMPAEQIPAWISEFQTSNRQNRIQTFLGALAFHWQFARLASPHPGPLESCPLTSFLATSSSTGKATEWHHQQHAASKDHVLTAAKLLQWLTDRVTKNHSARPQTTSTGPGTIGNHPEFLVLPFVENG